MQSISVFSIGSQTTKLYNLNPAAASKDNFAGALEVAVDTARATLITCQNQQELQCFHGVPCGDQKVLDTDLLDSCLGW